MFGVGSSEILLILVVVLLLFGSKELPQAAKTIGKGLRDFQRATQSARNEITRLIDEDDRKEIGKTETTEEKKEAESVPKGNEPVG
jgi:TatA/E family protein of Tat protein translocase